MHEARFTIRVGRLVAGPIEREIRRVAFEDEFELSIEKRMGLLGGMLYITLAHKDLGKLRKFIQNVQDWLDRMKRERT